MNLFVSATPNIFFFFTKSFHFPTFAKSELKKILKTCKDNTEADNTKRKLEQYWLLWNAPD